MLLSDGVDHASAELSGALWAESIKRNEEHDNKK
ncbi:hypothetical protein MY1884_008555, partial [Beauveria asiatica]